MIDVLIIGGGVAGLTVGAALAAQTRVMVLEAEGVLGYHASGRSAAMFEPNYGSAPVRALSRASEAFFREGGYLSPRGFLLVSSFGEDTEFEADRAALGCHEISVAAAQDFVPILKADHIARAGYHAGAEDIDTDRLLQSCARRIRHSGGAVETSARVTRIAWRGAHWEITAGEQHLKAARLVNAAGPWADHVARLAGVTPLGIVPHRRSMARIAAPGGHDLSAWPMFFGTGETWYAKPDAGQLIVSPAEEDPTDPMDAWADDLVLAEGMERYQAFVTEPVTRPVATWAGLRSFAPDRSLVLGPDPQNPAFVWCAGQGGYGFQTAPAASKLVADTILGRPSEMPAEIVAQLSPARFR